MVDLVLNRFVLCTQPAHTCTLTLCLLISPLMTNCSATRRAKAQTACINMICSNICYITQARICDCVVQRVPPLALQCWAWKGKSCQTLNGGITSFKEDGPTLIITWTSHSSCKCYNSCLCSRSSQAPSARQKAHNCTSPSPATATAVSATESADTTAAGAAASTTTPVSDTHTTAATASSHTAEETGGTLCAGANFSRVSGSFSYVLAFDSLL